MCEFARADVLTLAKAILEDPIEYSHGDYDPHFWCMYCMARSKNDYSDTEVKHHVTCPVLVAQDVLTRQD